MDISILKYLDILIGFVLVMALVSSFVTVLTQAWLSKRKKRADILEQGIASLLKRAEPSLTEDHAKKIAEKVLLWQTPKKVDMWDNILHYITLGFVKPEEKGVKRVVIMREQLVRILLEIIANPALPNEQQPPAEPEQAIINVFTNLFLCREDINQILNPEGDNLKAKQKADLNTFLESHASDPRIYELDFHALKDRVQNNTLTDDDREAIHRVYTDNRVYARDLIKKIDSQVCELEVNNPVLASHVVHTQAIIDAKAGKFVNAIMTNFDNMSESLTALFTSHSRIVTFVISLIVAVFLPLDTIDLLQRLATDDKLRATLVTTAMEVSKTNNIECNQPQKEPKSGTATGEATKKPSTGDQQSSFSTTTKPENDLIDCQSIKKAWVDLNEPKLGLVSHGGWSNITDTKNKENSPFKSGGEAFKFILGLFFSALLMTLGAPFWFDALKNLLKLRSSLAKTDDEAREARRDDQNKAHSSPVAQENPGNGSHGKPRNTTMNK